MKPKSPSSKSRKAPVPTTPWLDFDSPPATPPTTPMSPCLIAYIDGGSRGNPGVAGYGVHIMDASGQPVKDIYGYLGTRTNNYAEYSALLAALRFALQRQCTDLQVFSDSELLVRQINGIYKVKHPDMRALYDEAQEYIRRLAHFSIKHVYRDQNKEADRLANQAMDERASSS